MTSRTFSEKPGKRRKSHHHHHHHDVDFPHTLPVKKSIKKGTTTITTTKRKRSRGERRKENISRRTFRCVRPTDKTYNETHSAKPTSTQQQS